MISVEVNEHEGERTWGWHRFIHLPRRGDVIELWRDQDNLLLGRVEEVRHMEVDPETGNSDITLFVSVIK
jgi:hypothetical protein